MEERRILFIGAGNLGGHILDLFLRVPGQHRFLVGGRNVDVLRQRVNLSLLAAIQLGYAPSVECIALDLNEVERTANLIAHFVPHLIFCAATHQPLERNRTLLPSVAQQLALAPMGPRLPFHLHLVYKLMQAVRLSGLQASVKVLNAMYPDVVHPILGKVGLAPTIGIGDLANNIPALRLSIAWELRVPLERIDVRVIMSRWVSYWMSRKNIASWPFHLTAFLDGEDCTHMLPSKEAILEMLPTRLKRLGGEPGLIMTATSAATLFQAIISDQHLITHAPGPHGLPGGYPVRVTAQGEEIVLPAGLSLEAARQINEAGLRLDGIEQINEQGTVFFTEEARTMYQTMFGYECYSLSLEETEERMEELRRKYRERAF